MTQLVPFERDSSAQAFANRLVRLLTAAKAQKRSAEIFLALRGLTGDAPASLRTVVEGLSGERVRQLMGELEAGPLQAVLLSESDAVESLRFDLARCLRRIEQHAPGSDDDIRGALAREFEPLDTSPASVLRLADILGVHHELRLTNWTSRAKFLDDDLVQLASADSVQRRVSVVAIVPVAMPEVFEHFINFSRKISRGAGVIAAGQLAARYGAERGVPLAPHEVIAFLRPFAVHLGRHDGDDWFAFFNSANDFIRKATTRVSLLSNCSFEELRQFHQRFNRSLYASDSTEIPESVLKAALELAGFQVTGDAVTPIAPMSGQAGRGISDIQVRMVKVFRETLAAKGGRKSVRRAEFVTALLDAGLSESTATCYLGNKGLFSCSNGLCRLADAAANTHDAEDAELRAPKRRGRSAGATPPAGLAA